MPPQKKIVKFFLHCLLIYLIDYAMLLRVLCICHKKLYRNYKKFFIPLRVNSTKTISIHNQNSISNSSFPFFYYFLKFSHLFFPSHFLYMYLWCRFFFFWLDAENNKINNTFFVYKKSLPQAKVYAHKNEKKIGEDQFFSTLIHKEFLLCL